MLTISIAYILCVFACIDFISTPMTDIGSLKCFRLASKIDEEIKFDMVKLIHWIIESLVRFSLLTHYTNLVLIKYFETCKPYIQNVYICILHIVCY